MSLDERLRDALHGHADTIAPERGAWTEIVRRLDATSPRRRRGRWAVPAVVAVAAAVAVVWLLAGGGGSGQTDEQVIAGPVTDARLVAITTDDRLVELDPQGDVVREIADLAEDVDAQLGVEPGAGRPERPEVAIDPGRETAYVTREVPFVGHCLGDPERLSIIVAVDLATGIATSVAGRATTEVVSARSPAVAPDGALAYAAEVTTLPPDDRAGDAGCDRRWAINVQRDGQERSYPWPDAAWPPSTLAWSGAHVLVVTTQQGDQVTVQAVTTADPLASRESLDLQAPAAAGAAPGAGVVLAGSAEWAGVSLDHEVWYQPAVDPPPDFAGDMAEFVAPLFDLPPGAQPLAVSASDALERQRDVSDVHERADQLRASANLIRQQVAQIDASLASGSLTEEQAALASSKRTALDEKAADFEAAAIDLDVAGDLAAEDARAAFRPAVAVVVERDGGQRVALVWTGPDAPLVEVPRIEAVAWMPTAS